jgi:hypothetical protein
MLHFGLQLSNQFSYIKNIKNIKYKKYKNIKNIKNIKYKKYKNIKNIKNIKIYKNILWNESNMAALETIRQKCHLHYQKNDKRHITDYHCIEFLNFYWLSVF